MRGWAIELVLIALLVPFARRRSSTSTRSAAASDLARAAPRARCAAGFCFWLFAGARFHVFSSARRVAGGPARPPNPETAVAGDWPVLALLALARRRSRSAGSLARQRLAARRPITAEEELAGYTVALAGARSCSRSSSSPTNAVRARLRPARAARLALAAPAPDRPRPRSPRGSSPPGSSGPRSSCSRSRGASASGSTRRGTCSSWSASATSRRSRSASRSPAPRRRRSSRRTRPGRYAPVPRRERARPARAVPGARPRARARRPRAAAAGRACRGAAADATGRGTGRRRRPRARPAARDEHERVGRRRVGDHVRLLPAQRVEHDRRRPRRASGRAAASRGPRAAHRRGRGARAGTPAAAPSRPCSASSAGRTKSSNPTSEETGLPGRPKTSVAAADAERDRLARPDRDPPEDLLDAELGLGRAHEVVDADRDAAAS